MTLLRNYIQIEKDFNKFDKFSHEFAKKLLFLSEKH